MTLRSVQLLAVLATEASGTSKFVQRHCQSLSDAGHKVALAALKRGAPPEGLDAMLTTFAEGALPAKLGYAPGLRGWLHGQIAQADVMHTHGLWMLPYVWAGSAAARANKPLLVSTHGTLSSFAFSSGSAFKPIFWRLAQQRTLARAQAFHATGTPELADIRDRGFRQPVALIPIGVDMPPPVPNVPREGPKKLLYFGRLHPNKGVATLLLAWAQVEAKVPDWHLDIVGPDIDGFLGTLQDKAQQLGLSRVAFKGPVFGDAAKAELYRSADIYVLPSPSENFAMTVTEALACACPVLTTTGTPWAELSMQGAGWCVPTDADGLARGIEAALRTPRADLANMGAIGRTWMEASYTWPAVVAKFTALYAWLAGQGARPDFVEV